MPLLRSAIMCFGLLLTMGWAFSIARAQDGPSQDPYVVYVANEEAFARCGPSSDFYRTDPLRHGQALDVYAETKDGWLGVRPPEDSFCWVVAEAIELKSRSEHGTVVEDQTVAWIGTHLGRARKYRWQVRLAKGEPVTVIGRSEREGPDGLQLWYRVVPPSGEFRWIHRDEVVMSPEELVAKTKPVVAKTVLRDDEERSREFLPGGPTTRRAPRGPEAELAVSENAITTNVSSRRNPRVGQKPPRKELARAVGSGLKTDWQATEEKNELREPRQRDSENDVADQATGDSLLERFAALGRPRPIDANNDSSIEQAGAIIDRPEASMVSPAAFESPNPANSFTLIPNQLRQVGNQQPLTGNVLRQTPIAPVMPRTNLVSSEQIARIEAEARGADTERLTLIFSRLMADRASAPEIEPVIRAARQWAGATNDPVSAGRARVLVDRAIQYQQIAQRRDGQSVIQVGASRAVVPTNPLPPNDSPSRVTQSGYLVRVYSPRPNSPPFALTDHAGRTLAYVTPAPGVNIRRHLNSHIQVTGQQSFLRGLNIPHLMADQSSPTPE